jgi:hypothetical protein
MIARRIGLCAAVVFAVLILSGCGSDREPTDAELIQRFQKHRAEFETLRQMVESDKGLLRVDDTWTKPEDPTTIGVSAERIADYRARFHTLGIPRGFEAFGGPEHIVFLAWCQGITIAGSAKGYAWCEKAPENLALDLDAAHHQNYLEYQKKNQQQPNNWEKHLDLYRHIEGNWYLHFED